MRFVITGSSGHLGEALVRALQGTSHEVVGLDILPSPFTQRLGNITNREFVRESLRGAEAVIHAATLHKPHVATHSKQDFVDTNITGTLNLLEESVAAGVQSFVFTSTTSAFGRALVPPPGEPAAWITEDVRPIPKNIYGTTKVAAEDLCELFHRTHGLPCLILRTSRFFPELDDHPTVHQTYQDANIKANEFLYRRVDVEDVVEAHLRAFAKAPTIGFARYIISATTPFLLSDLPELRLNAPRVVQRYVPEYEDVYAKIGWKMFAAIERVYVNTKAREELGWRPRFDFRTVVECLRSGAEPRSELARVIGAKGYHRHA